MTMTDEQRAGFVGRLTQEQENLSKTLNEMRKERKDLKLRNIERHREFVMKIGELSFIFGGAVIPLLKDFAKSSTAAYLFGAIGLFILNGSVALWRSKSLLEGDGDDISGMGIEEETEVESYKHALQKLIHYPEDEVYDKEWLEARESLLNHFTDPKEQEEKISFWLDGFVVTFVIGSALLTRVIWPFQQGTFLWMFAALVILMCFLVLCSYFYARERRLKLAARSQRLRKINADRANWEKSFIQKAKQISDGKKTA